MTKHKTIEILAAFNAWRRGAQTEMLSPKQIGEAIDSAVKHLKESVRAGKLKKQRTMKAKAKAKA